ncbi:MAG: cysteine desulfurase [Cyanobacteria bacterium]|nr:cysteine desulfurase [Cyanobacteriota bacterium]
MPSVYLDFAATTPVHPEVLQAMMPFWQDLYGNPSSLHSAGIQTRKHLEKARNIIANCLNAPPSDFIFTGNGSEANNLAILGLAEGISDLSLPKKTTQDPQETFHAITTQIEHPCVLKPFETLEKRGWQVTYLPVDAEGFISLETFQQSLQPNTRLVSLMHGNNEMGAIQPISEISKILKARKTWESSHPKVIFHTDAVQTVGKIPINLGTLGVDALTFSAHKLYGPKGVGALFIKEDLHPLLFPQIQGGGQEFGLRSGTENVAGIVGLAKALEILTSSQSENKEAPFKNLRHLQAWFIQEIKNAFPEAVFNGPEDLNHRVPGNVNFSFPPLTGDSLVLQMDMKGIQVSSGSACHSAIIEPSHVISALGKGIEVAKSSLRFSLGLSTTQRELEETLLALKTIIPKMMKKAQGRSALPLT